MKRLNLLKTSFILILLLLSTFALRAQTELNDLPTATTWRDFKVGATNPDEVIKVLGKPKKDQAKRSEKVLMIIQPNSGEKFRHILYKKIGNYDSVEFSFNNERLVEMNFLFDQNQMKGLFNRKSNLLPAVKLGELFNTNFFLFNGLPKNSNIGDFEGQKETTVPKVYKQIYSMMGINKETIIMASIDNTTFKSGLKEIFDKPTVENFPGYVQRIQIQSR